MTTWKDSLERRDEVKAAYIEGHLAAFEFEAGCVSEGAKQQRKPTGTKATPASAWKTRWTVSSVSA
jgi:hypothetical protein